MANALPLPKELLPKAVPLPKALAALAPDPNGDAGFSFLSSDLVFAPPNEKPVAGFPNAPKPRDVDAGELVCPKAETGALGVDAVVGLLDCPKAL